MTCQITFQDREVQLNNRNFSNLIFFVLSVAQSSAQSSCSKIEISYVERLQEMFDNEFWPGRGIEIETDFPNLEEQKFWCRMFFDTARAIVHGELKDTKYKYWQASTIYLAYATGRLFEYAVQTVEPKWLADTLDRIEFRRLMNKGKRQ